MAERLSIFNLEQTINRKRATMQMFETLLGGTKTLIRELEAKLIAEKQLAEARTWPNFTLLETEILVLMQSDSDAVAKAKADGWSRPYTFDIKRAYDVVKAKHEAKRITWLRKLLEELGDV